ncbi:hypothetical protein GCM10009737_05810 [Nocardioides lentus]|uniref:Lipoprotein n=1 Tax=Nocardioides lentus TaxID=338077 RepID=A0ABN2P0G3_9ACTN
MTTRARYGALVAVAVMLTAGCGATPGTEGPSGAGASPATASASPPTGTDRPVAEPEVVVATPAPPAAGELVSVRRGGRVTCTGPGAVSLAQAVVEARVGAVDVRAVRGVGTRDARLRGVQLVLLTEEAVGRYNVTQTADPWPMPLRGRTTRGLVRSTRWWVPVGPPGPGAYRVPAGRQALMLVRVTGSAGSRSRALQVDWSPDGAAGSTGRAVETTRVPLGFRFGRC